MSTPVLLQELIAATPAGGTVPLAGDVYDNPDPNAEQGIRINKKIKLDIASSARLIVTKSKNRNRPAVLVLPDGVLDIEGRLDIVCPEGPRRDDLEGQSGIEFRGCDAPTLNGVHVLNAQGTSFAATRDIRSGKLTTNMTLLNTASYGPGRGHYLVNGIDTFHIAKPYMEECGRGHSSIVFEPNGHWDACLNGLIEDGYYHGNTGFCFSAGGLSTSQPAKGNFANVTFRRMRSRGMMDLHLGNAPGNRRGPFFADALEGHTVANKPTVFARGFDGLHITNYSQATTAKSVWDIDDCTDVITSLAA